VGLGIIVGTTMWLSSDVVVQEKVWVTTKYEVTDPETGQIKTINNRELMDSPEVKTTKTSIPFLKDTALDYKELMGDHETLAWLFYILMAIFIITAVSNGANLTDGIDGLLTGVSIPIVMVLGVLAYLSGHIIYSDYLNIMYIPHSAELIVFATAFVGALVGFLWYNSFPAQIFMGDTGSLTIGGIIAVFALCIRKELLLPLLCGVFLVEALSVMVQVGYFKYTKRKYGEGRRILLMSPIHHHYQKKGLFETKIMMRFFIISLLLSALTLVTLKIQ
jgi:phospho-N-acetylmuramoyl-pentapeptide-transferase